MDVEPSELSTSYEERQEKTIYTLMQENKLALKIMFNNIEYILGNADFEDTDIEFEQLESLRHDLGKMGSYLDGDNFDDLQR